MIFTKISIISLHNSGQINNDNFIQTFQTNTWLGVPFTPGKTMAFSLRFSPPLFSTTFSNLREYSRINFLFQHSQTHHNPICYTAKSYSISTLYDSSQLNLLHNNICLSLESFGNCFLSSSVKLSFIIFLISLVFKNSSLFLILLYKSH